MISLALFDQILKGRSMVYEGDIFATLKEVPYVVRSFEFAPVDGALDLLQRHVGGGSWADRLDNVIRGMKKGYSSASEPSATLLLFDVKSTIARCAGEQIYKTTEGQRSLVAFYIGICAADSSFVEIIPNYYQHQPVEKPDREVSVNSSKQSRFPPSLYGLDPCNAPYRMPLTWLPRAIHRLRKAVVKRETYQNPWTGVSFPDWRPTVARSADVLRPAAGTGHFTAYRIAMNILDWINCDRIKPTPLAMALQGMRPTAIAMDMIGLQPRLADFKFLVFSRPLDSQTKSALLGLARAEFDGDILKGWEQRKDDTRTSSRQTSRPFWHLRMPNGQPIDVIQYLVQHKTEGKLRGRHTPLSQVKTARDGRYYFTSLERFDYLFFQFEFNEGPSEPPRVEFFFLPEHIIPDQFYESSAGVGDFELPAFQPFRILMDDDGQWVEEIRQIIQEHPQPRLSDARPLRPLAGVELSDEGDDTVGDDPSISPPTEAGDPTKSSGRRDYTRVLLEKHRLFYKTIMDQCAARSSGLLLILASDQAMGDFAFCAYSWKKRDLDNWYTKGLPPRTLDSLPPCTPIVPLYYFAKDLECNYHGGTLLSTQFRRLNSCRNGRLVLWDLWGPDSNGACPLVLVPSIDLQPTDIQRRIFAENLHLEERKYAQRTPWLNHILQTGDFGAQYAIGSRGPLVYEGIDWAEVWQMLFNFTQILRIEHPLGRFHEWGNPRNTKKTSLNSYGGGGIENIDNANNLENLGLWSPLVGLLGSEEAELRRYAAWCLGTAVQNNVKAQTYFLATGAMPTLTKLAIEDTNEPVRRKAIYALSSEIRNYQQGLDAAVKALPKGIAPEGAIDAGDMTAVDRVIEQLREDSAKKAA